MEARSSQSSSGSRRLLKRRALGDITNVVASSSSTAAASVKRPSKLGAKPKPPLRAIPDEVSTRFATSSVGSCNSGNPGSRKDAPLAPAARVTETWANAAVDWGNEPPKVYSLRNTKKQKNKWKTDTDVLQSSCPPIERIKSMRDNLKLEHGDIDRHGTCSVPYPKPKKKRHYALTKVDKEGELMPPREFIEKQKAYFAEIDAFELPEEVVSESELE
uniref:Sororin C-terminal region domain-containing protein n=1 Tax=Anthurium amnicola TaxID=1678845 RepID=A0A1D1ZH27_9ARAE